MYQHYGSASLRRRRFRSRIKIYSIASAVLCVLIFFAYLIFQAGFFKVQKFEFANADVAAQGLLLKTLREQVLETKIGGILGTDNYFSWNDSINYSDARFSGISLDKQFFKRAILITAIPRQRYAAWCNKTPELQCYWIDEGGVIFEQAAIPEGPLIKRVNDETESIFIGSPAVSESWFAVIRKILEGLGSLNVQAVSADLDRSKQELQVLTRAGTQIIFSLRFDPSISALPAVGRLLETSGSSKISRLDLTVEGRAFIR